MFKVQKSLKSLEKYYSENREVAPYVIKTSHEFDHKYQLYLINNSDVSLTTYVDDNDYVLNEHGDLISTSNPIVLYDYSEMNTQGSCITRRFSKETHPHHLIDTHGIWYRDPLRYTERFNQTQWFKKCWKVLKHDLGDYAVWISCHI